MSISDPEVEANEPTAVNGDPNFVLAPTQGRPGEARRSAGAAPSPTRSSRWSRSAATSSAPASLILLSQLSPAAVNAPGQFATNIELDSLFPVAVVIALAFGGVYRVTHRRL
jgi:hypothetical protein